VSGLTRSLDNSIWLLTLVNNFKSTIVLSLTPFATSDWQSHSLLTVIGIVSNAMTAAVYIPTAKMLDVWGRAEGFLLMLGLCILGLIMMASSANLSTYCAAQVSVVNLLMSYIYLFPLRLCKHLSQEDVR